MLVHNGIIENFAALKTYLVDQGHEFESDTDTEVLAHLIAHFYEDDLEEAVRQVLKEVTGAYAIAVMSEKEPEVLVEARAGSPLMIGVGNGEYVVASDASAIVAHTNQAIELDDDTIARLTTDTFRTSDLENVTITPQMRELEVDLEQIELGDYPHYMIKEIYEQPEAIRRCLKGRLAPEDGRVVLGGLSEYARELGRTQRVMFLGQGTGAACRHDRLASRRESGEDSQQGGFLKRVPLPKSDHRGWHGRRGHQSIRGDGRYARGASRGIP